MVIYSSAEQCTVYTVLIIRAQSGVNQFENHNLFECKCKLIKAKRILKYSNLVRSERELKLDSKEESVYNINCFFVFLTVRVIK